MRGVRDPSTGSPKGPGHSHTLWDPERQLTAMSHLVPNPTDWPAASLV